MHGIGFGPPSCIIKRAKDAVVGYGEVFPYLQAVVLGRSAAGAVGADGYINIPGLGDHKKVLSFVPVKLAQAYIAHPVFLSLEIELVVVDMDGIYKFRRLVAQRHQEYLQAFQVVGSYAPVDAVLVCPVTGRKDTGR